MEYMVCITEPSLNVGLYICFGNMGTPTKMSSYQRMMNPPDLLFLGKQVKNLFFTQ